MNSTSARIPREARHLLTSRHLPEPDRLFSVVAHDDRLAVGGERGRTHFRGRAERHQVPLPVAESHSNRPSPPVSAVFPSGENATASTSPTCAIAGSTNLPVPRSNRRWLPISTQGERLPVRGKRLLMR